MKFKTQFLLTFISLLLTIFTTLIYIHNLEKHINGSYKETVSDFGVKFTSEVNVDKFKTTHQELDITRQNINKTKMRFTLIRKNEKEKLDVRKDIEVPTEKSPTDQLTEKVQKCSFSKHRLFPLCLDKMKEIQKNWRNDSCLHNVHNINGTLCSMYRYLTEAEPFCAGLDDKANRKEKDTLYTIPNYKLKDLLEILSHEDLSWMRKRAEFVFPTWVLAAKSFMRNGRRVKKKKIAVFFGAFSVQSHFLRNAGTGGPLGELIQWVDLITGLFVLGYNIRVSFFDLEFKTAFMGDGFNIDCPQFDSRMADIVYTDLVGLSHLRLNCGAKFYNKYRCTYRVLDSFGTFPEYNYKNTPADLLPTKKSDWGGNNLITTQFLTLYPHTHDNTFLGFVVNNSTVVRKNITKKRDMALLYAKKSSYLRPDSIKALEIAARLFEIHATCVLDTNKDIFEKLNIHNHGPVSSKRVQELLSEAKLFIGTGFPYEGPGPLEAMQAGTVYIQPIFHPPRSAKNAQFFWGKPNLRELKSQNPYMEDHVGEPYCFTLDYNNKPLVTDVLKRIKEMPQLPKKIPREFQSIGMIERIYAITEKMDFCDPQTARWPPLKNLKVVVAHPGDSCKRTCLSKKLVCENSYFDIINSVSYIEQFFGVGKCKNIKNVVALHPPSFDHVTETCYLQTQSLLFSCMHQAVTTIQRLCPCRDYEEEHTAICKNCL